MSPILEVNTLDFISHSEIQTFRFGVRLGNLLAPGDVVGLIGELGCGKTRWIQGMCEGLAVTDRVISPTFTLVNEYQGKYPIYHIDLYRLDNIKEADSFGLDEYLFGSGITLIEWADRALDILPNEYLLIELYHLNDTHRRVVIRPYGERLKNVIQIFKKNTFAR
jgi:tRNA threonylcarbamoyladenosine biosynthesis protein TsaE